jgi:hypothetical protein
VNELALAGMPRRPERVEVSARGGPGWALSARRPRILLLAEWRATDVGPGGSGKIDIRWCRSWFGPPQQVIGTRSWLEQTEGFPKAVGWANAAVDRPTRR